MERKSNDRNLPVPVIMPIVAVIAAIGVVSGPISPTTTAPHPAETIAEEYGGGGNTGNDVSPFI
ncbi:hypothetical protein ACWEF6_19945 [Amycolatopsis sp. NPDC004772]